MEAHYVEAPSVGSVVDFIKRTYPHNFDQVLPTMVEIGDWPKFWKTIDSEGRVLPTKN